MGMYVDPGSPLARRVAENVWSGLSRAALDAGLTKTTALWRGLHDDREDRIPGPSINIFIGEQGRPEDIEAVRAVETPGEPRLYGVVVAVPDKPSPLAGSLLYQGVERLTGTGVRAGLVEPALLHARPRECEAYAGRLLERLAEISRR